MSNAKKASTISPIEKCRMLAEKLEELNQKKRKFDEDKDDDEDEDDEKKNKIQKGEWSECLEEIWQMEKRRYKTTDSKETIDELTRKTLLISEEMERKMPTLRKIIESNNLDEKTRNELIPLYILHENSGFSFEKNDLREAIIEKFNTKQLSRKNMELKNRLSIDNESNSMEERIFNLDLPEDQVKIIYQKYLSFTSMSNDEGNTKEKTREWLDYAMRLPTKIKPLACGRHDAKEKEAIKTKEFLLNVKKVLDESLYGMKKEKEQLLLVINTMISNPSCTNLTLGFLGEAGVGKTELVRSLAKALDIPFTHISMGGCHDSSFLTGHNIVYEGAQPGAILKALCRSGYKNGIIYFDEIDKLEETTRGRGVMNTLLHILDPAQNKIFQDHFLDELPIDISQIWMIYSLNDKSKLDKPLLDRMKIINVGNHSKASKFHILKSFSIPKILKNLGLDEKVAIFKDDAIKHLINIFDTSSYSSGTSGIRGLNQTIEEILSRVSILGALSLPQTPPLKESRESDEKENNNNDKEKENNNNDKEKEKENNNNDKEKENNNSNNKNSNHENSNNDKKQGVLKGGADPLTLTFSFSIPNISFPLLITPEIVDTFLKSFSPVPMDKGYEAHQSMIC
jgi:ATP-dependent Lon protease